MFPPPRRRYSSLILGVSYVVFGLVILWTGDRLLGGMYLLGGLINAPGFWFGRDFLNWWAPIGRARARRRAARDPEFASAAEPVSSTQLPYEVRFEPPTRWTYIVRCRADSERQAVAKAHLALTYRERNGLKGWVAADGVTAIGGARLTVEGLPAGSRTNDWRVDYITPDGSYFSK